MTEEKAQGCDMGVPHKAESLKIFTEHIQGKRSRGSSLLEYAKGIQ
jgi:hypothetical protein